MTGHDDQHLMWGALIRRSVVCCTPAPAPAPLSLRDDRVEGATSRQSVSLPQPLSKVENPAFRAGLRGWLGDRVGRDAGMF